jgi:hypothetical protein
MADLRFFQGSQKTLRQLELQGDIFNCVIERPSQSNVNTLKIISKALSIWKKHHCGSIWSSNDKVLYFLILDLKKTDCFITIGKSKKQFLIEPMFNYTSNTPAAKKNWTC